MTNVKLFLNGIAIITTNKILKKVISIAKILLTPPLNKIFVVT